MHFLGSVLSLALTSAQYQAPPPYQGAPAAYAAPQGPPPAAYPHDMQHQYYQGYPQGYQGSGTGCCCCCGCGSGCGNKVANCASAPCRWLGGIFNKPYHAPPPPPPQAPAPKPQTYHWEWVSNLSEGQRESDETTAAHTVPNAVPDGAPQDPCPQVNAGKPAIEPQGQYQQHNTEYQQHNTEYQQHQQPQYQQLQYKPAAPPVQLASHQPSHQSGYQNGYQNSTNNAINPQYNHNSQYKRYNSVPADNSNRLNADYNEPVQNGQTNQPGYPRYSPYEGQPSLHSPFSRPAPNPQPGYRPVGFKCQWIYEPEHDMPGRPFPPRPDAPQVGPAPRGPQGPAPQGPAPQSPFPQGYAPQSSAQRGPVYPQSGNPYDPQAAQSFPERPAQYVQRPMQPQPQSQRETKLADSVEETQPAGNQAMNAVFAN